MLPGVKPVRFGLCRFFFGLAICLGILALGLTPAWSQTSTAGTVAGQVVDEQNAAIPGAEIKVTDVTTNSGQSTLSNDAGRFIFSSVPPGTYNITVSKQGFSTYSVNSQSVQVGQVLTINAKMKVGSTATTVEVTASTGAELQTMNATVGNTLTGRSLIEMPNMGRDVTALSVLQPGVTMSGQIAGSPQDANTYTLDGGNATDDMGGNTVSYQVNYAGLGGSQGSSIPSGVIPTPAESIEEFKVSVSNQTSDFNNSSGGQIQMVTKRGSNELHGAAYMFYFDTAVGSANTWQGNHTPFSFGSEHLPYTPIISNHRDRFGAALGGPLIPKDFLGKKWYFFFNYEGLRFPNAGLYTKAVPSLLLRAGVIQVPDASGVYQPYNLNPNPVTVNGVTYAPAVCPGGACDPRGLGLNPVVNQIWQKQMPLPNSITAAGDTYNTQGFLGTIRAPLTSNNYVGRIDHDFSDKWHWYVTYRDFSLINLTTNQVDVGGVLPGDTFGNPSPTAPRPQKPSFWATGLTTNISPTVTNTFVFNYTRTFWQWASDMGPAQLPGLGGALEIGGEFATDLIPYNVNSQNVRERFWDGQDKLTKDDLTMIKGNHLFGFGGSWQRNFDYHSRSDNGAGVNNQISYLSTNGGFTGWNNYIPTSVPSSQYTNYQNYYAYVTGMLSSTQVMYTRSGSQLNLEPLGSNAYNQSIIPTYATYFYDTWHAKPTLTFTYGLGYNLEMPPYELNGNQVELVDSNNQPISTTAFIAQREKAALQGSSYTPEIGYSLVRNVGSGLKYPYNPYYGEFSPRAALAWNPNFTDGILGKVFGSGKTVIRGGYGRIFGRLNGVDLVLVPLLGPGLLQGVTCTNPLMTGGCAGTGVATPGTAFRIGTDGLKAPLGAATPTLPQPYFPGVNGYPETVDPDALDPNFRPDRTDNFTLTVQRELTQHTQLEVGYIGKIIRNEYMLLNLDAVPYMTTLGGQSFAQAFSQLYQQMVFNGVNPLNVSAQPFIENALGGASSAYCAGFSNCTAALAHNNTNLIRETAVSDLWNKMSAAPSWTLGRTLIAQPVPGNTVGQATSVGINSSLGWGNYNALFVSFHTTDWHGLTSVSNFTWSRSLGTTQLLQLNSSSTPLTPYDLGANYGPQGFDIPLQYNFYAYYTPPVFTGQRGILGHILGGWTFSPVFTAQSGTPLAVGYSEGSCSGCQAFGEVTTPGNSAVSSTSESAVGFGPYTGGSSAHYNQYGSSGSNIWQGTQSVGTKTAGTYGMNMFTNPGQVYGEFRPCVLGFDSSCASTGAIRGFPTWNLDLGITKDIGIYKERVGAQLFITITNVMNHFQPGTPSGGTYLSLTNPTQFGQILSQANTPRNMEFGLRIHW